ncbi:hypothetical protein N7492_001756 [Penicillium capsulatum]|uniref:Uncharacterized protein n=1 Tax=Penicillium capsulatum TaxID=69766 RepID=A0A9W9IW89_9EURO|nr:hypothetical protein N7492_001756 [Penicillium capsulatum]KAJ6129194.1 hypothetical protein N7512_001974 [Penicillium capsulatum]
MSDDDPFLDPPRPIRRLGPTWMEATRHVPMDIDRYLEPDPPLPDLLQEARGLGIAADTFKHPPYLDLDLTWGAGSPYYDQITEQLIHEDREFRAELQSLVLDIQDSDKKRMTQMLYDEENPGEPDWKTILPPIRSSDVQPEPHRLTYQGELVAKRILTTKLAGPDFAASLPPEDSPFEIENLKITPAMQKIADDYRKAQAFEKLECGKESLAFLADLPNQKLDGVYDDVLPKPKVFSTLPRVCL